MREALSLDLDGPIIKRPPFQVEAAFKRALHGRSGIYSPLSEIPELDRTVGEQPLSPLDRISLIALSSRHLVPKVADYLKEVNGQYDLYGNTGRPNERLWVQITQRTLEEDGILYLFKDIFFTPRGTSWLLSKGAGIKELQERGYKVTHVDDDPLTVLRLARFFPKVSFVLVEDLTTGVLLSGVNITEYPNVGRARTLREGFSRRINR